MKHLQWLFVAAGLLCLAGSGLSHWLEAPAGAQPAAAQQEGSLLTLHGTAITPDSVQENAGVTRTGPGKYMPGARLIDERPIGSTTSDANADALPCARVKLYDGVMWHMQNPGVGFGYASYAIIIYRAEGKKLSYARIPE